MLDWTTVENFPGAELVIPGLRDAAAGRLTIESCLISIARPLIEASGLTQPLSSITYIAEPERALYRLLQNEPGDAYGRYNSLVRGLVSFERAVRRAQSQLTRDPAIHREAHATPIDLAKGREPSSLRP